MPSHKKIKEIQDYNASMSRAIAQLKDLALNQELDKYSMRSFSFSRMFFGNKNESHIYFHCLDDNKKPVVFLKEHKTTAAYQIIKMFIDILKYGSNYSDPLLGLRHKEFSFTKESLTEMESLMLKPDLKILLEKNMLEKEVKNIANSPQETSAIKSSKI